MTDAFTAVDVLVARMESNPEDFLHGGKFRWVADATYEMIINYSNGTPKNNLKWILTEQEQVRLMAAYRNLSRMQFQQEVFAKLCADPAEESKYEWRVKNIEAPKILGTQEVLAKAQEVLNAEYDGYMQRQAIEAQQNAARGAPWGGALGSVANTFFGGKK
jgi:hypothetical protein